MSPWHILTDQLITLTTDIWPDASSVITHISQNKARMLKDSSCIFYGKDDKPYYDGRPESVFNHPLIGIISSILVISYVHKMKSKF